MADYSAVTVPGPGGRLDEATARRAPAGKGVYAAWITDAAALAECGVEGPAPRVVYIGKASGQGGLRLRLLRHARNPFWSMVDLLAMRGKVRPGWWQYAVKNQPYLRSLHAPPLAQDAERDALAWQREHLRWGWMRVAKAGTVESALIAQHQPLLNLRGRGYSLLGPPQLRAIGEWESARAAWLFSCAWIAILTAAEDGWIRRPRGRPDEVEIDDEGWPVPVGRGANAVRVKQPSERAARLVLRRAFEEIGEVASFHDDEEASAWWAAYAGLPARPREQSVEEAIRLAVRCQPGALDTPRALPSAARRSELLSIIKWLPGVAH